MKVWKVGGAVRDALLGRPCGDTDWVVTGATPKQMVAAGYTPVGRDFPVFLHPTTKEEYALARTERSTAPGYHGFVFHTAPDVTLEQDLQRRDLTINAMAVDADGTLIDPYGGQRDVAARLLRHVSAAFAEDPVRILRLARFAARFDDFSVAPETAQLMRQMVDAGEADALRAAALCKKTFELCDFLLNVLKVDAVPGRFDGTVTYHDACSGLRELGIKQQPRALLGAAP